MSVQIDNGKTRFVNKHGFDCFVSFDENRDAGQSEMTVLSIIRVNKHCLS